MKPFVVLAAGVLAIAPQSWGEPVEVFGGEFAVGDGSAGFNIDVDADGFIDLNFAFFGVSVNSVFAWDGVVRRGNVVSDTHFAAVLDPNDQFVHPRLAAGDMIGLGVLNSSTSGAIAYEVFFDGTDGGDWLDQERGYVAFSFMGQAGTRLHYGWAEVSVDTSKGTDDGFLILHRIGYETLSDTPILAGAPLGCNAADLNSDGDLDFLDISAFLSGYSSQDPIADLNGDGAYDFLDISAFLAAYTNGCP